MTPAPSSREPLWADAAASLVTFTVSAVIVALVIMDRLPGVAFVLAHVGCAAVAILIAVTSGQPPRRQAILHAVMASALGPVGSAGSFLCAVFEFCFRPFATPFGEWFDSIFQEEDRDETALFVDRLLASEDPVTAAQRVVSYKDILSNGSIEQKQAILGLIGRRFAPAFAPALRQALHDPVPSVRVQAASVAAAVEGRYSERLAHLRVRAAKPGASTSDLRSIGDHFVEFAESGIAEDQRRDEAFTSALESYDAILKSSANDGPALLASAKILLRRGNALEADKRLKRASSILGVSPEVVTLQMEAHIQLGAYEELGKLARQWKGRFSGAGHGGQRLEQALSLWTRSAALG